MNEFCLIFIIILQLKPQIESWQFPIYAIIKVRNYWLEIENDGSSSWVKNWVIYQKAGARLAANSLG